MEEVVKDASLGKLLFNFILLNVIFIIGYQSVAKKKTSKMIWVLIILFCLFSFWGGDYFSYKAGFGKLTKDFRDPLYYYIQEISLNYTMYRFLIWGVAVLLYYYAAKRLKLPMTIAAFSFATVSMLSFSYSRSSLGLCLYLLGGTYLIKPVKGNELLGYLFGFVLILLSYYGHRSLLPMIAASPLFFFRLTKQRAVFALLMIPVFALVVSRFMSAFVVNAVSLGDGLDDFTDAAGRYARTTERSYNWKGQLVSYWTYASYYVTYIVLAYKMLFAPKPYRNNRRTKSRKIYLMNSPVTGKFSSIAQVGSQQAHMEPLESHSKISEGNKEDKTVPSEDIPVEGEVPGKGNGKPSRRANKRLRIHPFALKLLTISTLLVIVSSVFFVSGMRGATQLIGYRYLVMAGPFLSLLLAYAYKRRLLSFRQLFYVLLLPISHAEVAIFGKIFTGLTGL